MRGGTRREEERRGQHSDSVNWRLSEKNDLNAVITIP